VLEIASKAFTELNTVGKLAIIKNLIIFACYSIGSLLFFVLKVLALHYNV
jgi:hypothetical protein